MKKIIDHKILADSGFEYLDSLIKGHINQGWEVYGNLVWADATAVQVMVKYAMPKRYFRSNDVHDIAHFLRSGWHLFGSPFYDIESDERVQALIHYDEKDWDIA